MICLLDKANNKAIYDECQLIDLPNPINSFKNGSKA